MRTHLPVIAEPTNPPCRPWRRRPGNAASKTPCSTRWRRGTWPPPPPGSGPAARPESGLPLRVVPGANAPGPGRRGGGIPRDIYLLPEFLRLRAEALYRLDPTRPRPKRAGPARRKRWKLARQQRAPALELRVTSGLCRHRSQNGDRQTLAEAVGRYRESMAPPDQQTARRLLVTPPPEETA